MQYVKKKKIFGLQMSKGFAMLFTVLIVSLILTIALSISNITYKQTILSGLVKNSQIAFYQADAGIECGLYFDVYEQSFTGGDPSTAPSTLECGNQNLKIDGASQTNYFIYVNDLDGSNNPCFSLVIDKTDPPNTIIQSRGNNLCTPSVRQVERALEARYQ